MITDDKVQINIERGKAGLFYATSPQIKSLLVAEKSFIECLEAIPETVYKLEMAARNAKL